MSPQVANVPTALTANTFTRSGYSFSGWNTMAGGGGTAYADEATYSFSEDITLYAQWTVLPNHTVSFNGNGGSGTMALQVANVPTALTANAFTRIGYSFSGWGTSAGGPVVYSNGATYSFSSDITLYAQWTALPNHTVTFISNGGSGTMSPQIANVPTALTANAFTRSGYSFSGWNTMAGGGGTAYANGATYSFAVDITLYAQWTALPNHTVTFDANGGTGTMAQQVANVPTPLTANTFTRSGYTFSGWGTSTGGPVVYSNGATYSFSEDITLYAQWTVAPTVTSVATPSDATPDVGDTITVSININISNAALGSYTGTLDWDPDILDYQSYSGAPPAGFSGAVNTGGTGTGHIAFNGANASGATGNIIVLVITFDVVDSGTSALDLGYSSMAAASTFVNLLPYLTITDGQVVASAPYHMVTFNANGGLGTMTSQVANVPTVLTANAFTRSGYSFSGWNTQPGGGGTAYADGATYSFATDITLYAQWTALPNHTVTFDSNGGSGTMTPQVANVPTALTANAFTRSGYSFSGWGTSAGGPVVYTDGATYSFSEDITLYAQWTALPNHTVTFNANGGTGTMSDQVANVPTALTANVFTRSGYSFSGWGTSAEGPVVYSDGATYSFSADITLYAQWTALPMTCPHSLYHLIS